MADNKDYISEMEALAEEKRKEYDKGRAAEDAEIRADERKAAAKEEEARAEEKKSAADEKRAKKKGRKMTLSSSSKAPAAMGLFIFALIVHLIDLMFGRLSGNNDTLLFSALIVFYALLTVYSWKALGAATSQDKWSCALISAIALLLPNIVSLLAKILPVLPTDIVNFLLVFMPIWPIYLLLWHGDKIGKVFQWVGWLYFIFWIIIFFLAYSGPIKTVVAELGTQDIAGIQPGTAVKEIWAKAGAGLAQMYNATVSYKNKQAQQLQALGFYEGQVDSKAKEQLGVYFGELKSLKAEYASGEFVDIFTTLSAQTLDKPLDISLSCEGPAGVKGEITPESQLHVEMFDQPSIDCMIKQGFVVGKGLSESKTITLSAGFKFSTMSYLRSYFMELEKLRTLRRMSIEPLSQYGITDKNPKAVSTSGPVLIGMSLGESLPIGIDSKGGQLLTLGITLSNKWTGKMGNITKIVLVLPKGIVLSSVLPVNNFVAGDCSGIEGCDAKTQNVYFINGISLPFGEASYTTIRAMLKVESPGSLLGVAPLAIKSIWAIADYDYTLQKAKTITVRG
jgi:hypothetical protein